MASLYTAQKRYAEAEPLHNRSLAIREKALGPNHPLVATSLNDLGLLYSIQGRYADAERLFKPSLAIREQVFSPDHPDVKQSRDNLAELYRVQGEHNSSSTASNLTGEALAYACQGNVPNMKKEKNTEEYAKFCNAYINGWDGARFAFLQGTTTFCPPQIT